MADYSTIKGFTIQELAADPYTSKAAAGTWSAGNNMNVARSRIAGCGIATAGLAIAGVNGGPQVTDVEEFDGTCWSADSNVNQAREAGAAATNAPTTSTLFFGGNAPPIGQADLTESWNGTTWTEVADLLGARSGGGGAGNSNTSALYFGGESPVVASSESYNGTCWTETADLNTARAYVPGVGLNTAALAIGGQIQ